MTPLYDTGTSLEIISEESPLTTGATPNIQGFRTKRDHSIDWRFDFGYRVFISNENRDVGNTSRGQKEKMNR